jgi:DHA1 family bicyclomycin/chloramphenicol resistance-like MFS transporter
MQQGNEQKKTIHGTKTEFSTKYFTFLMIFLGMLSAFGPFLTDMYLPALPSMVHDFNTTESLVQLSLTMGMIGLAVGQIFFGPMSQKWGRKSVLFGSMFLFIIGAISCIYSTDIKFFLLCRLAQGLGGAGGIVLSRSIATDCYSGRELAKTMAIIGAINGIAPAFAPVIGGLLSNAIGWQGIFASLTGLGVILLIMTSIFKETLPKAKRFQGSIFSTFKEYKGVLRMRRFVLLILAYGFGMGTLFAYISAAPFVIQQQFGLNEIGFSITFGINSVLIGLGSGLALKFKSLDKALLIGAVGMLVMAIVQIGFVELYYNFVTYEISTIFLLLFLGIVITTTTSMAMDEGREYTGAAAAIVGAIGFLMGGVVSPIVGFGNIEVTTAITIVATTLILTLLALSLYKSSKSLKK